MVMKSQKSEIYFSKLNFAVKPYHFLILLAFFYFSPSFLQAQIYKPIDTADQSLRNKFIEKYKLQDELFLQQVKKDYGKNSKELIAGFKEFSDNFISQVKAGQFVFDDRFTSKAEEIVTNIFRANKIEQQHTLVIISKDPTLNAFCLPNGTFIINMGVFYWLDNSDQLAGVLSHEISHKILNHTIKFQLREIADRNSATTKSEMKAVRRMQYNRREAAIQLFKNKLYASGEERRKNEFQADSLGYSLLKKSDYHSVEFIEALRLMERYDTLRPEPLNDEVYRIVFDLPNQKFKEEWLKTEDLSGYDYTLWKSKFDKDSAASHPQLEDRIRTLENMNPELRDTIAGKSDDSFKELHRIAGLELIPNLYFLEEYGLAVYICLKRIQLNKEPDYYKQWLGKNFAQIYDARKNYRLNRYLDTVDPKNQTPSYQKYLNFMWNLSLDEIKNISDYYTANFK